MKIVLPVVDLRLGLAQAEAVIPYARQGATLILVSILGQSFAGYRYGFFTDVGINNERIRIHRQELLDRLIEKLSVYYPPDKLSKRLISGDPSQEIKKLIAAEQADLMILAQCPKPGWIRFIAKSICQKLFKESDCSILILKPSLSWNSYLNPYTRAPGTDMAELSPLSTA